MTASQEREYMRLMGLEMTLDDDTRQYLKRLIRDNPQAVIIKPEGYYDSDEELE